MNVTPTDEDIAGVKDLIARSEVKAIEYHEVSARWTGTRAEESDGSEAEMELQLQQRCGPNDFGFRMVGSLSMSYGEVSVTVAVAYSYTGDVPLRRAFLAFGNEVAAMTLFPYYREAVASITAKVFGEPILLQVMERGDVGFDLDNVKNEPVLTHL